MAQLRDAQTSELIAEGTPLELVTIAEELGLNTGVVGTGETADGFEALYDGVGLGFDPATVSQARDENLDGLEAGSDALAAAQTEFDDAKARAPQVQAALDAARASVE